jgi:hypothetical protein
MLRIEESASGNMTINKGKRGKKKRFDHLRAKVT